MTKKAYPLDVVNVSVDYYAFMSKGHHNVHDFMRQLVDEFGDHYVKHIGYPLHIWMKTVPDSAGDYQHRYAQVPEGVRGSYPVTFVCEYGTPLVYLEECKARKEVPYLSQPLAP